MKKTGLLKLLTMIMFATSVAFTACKNKSKDTTTNTDTQKVVNPAPVEVSSDQTLNNGVNDATKDYPGVTPTVNNGEVTLTGTIDRDRLPTLIQTIQGL